MAIKQALTRITKNLAARGAQSVNSRAVNTAATAASLLPYLKWIIVVVLVLVLLVVLGSTANGIQRGVTEVTRMNNECQGIPSKSEVDKYFTDNGYTLSEQDKEKVDARNTDGGCQKQGVGFNGEVFPPTTGITTEYFGTYRADPPRYHGGMDIASSCGTPIYAFAGGEVTDVVMGTEAKSSAGNYVTPMGRITIKHTDTFSTGYLHMNGSTTKVKVGDIVSAGDEIAGQWSNGPSTGCHLHIEAYESGERVDMNKYLAECGFSYVLGQVFNELPPAPVMCGNGELAEGGGGDVKAYAKSQMQSMMNIPSSSVNSEFQCLDNLWNRESNWRPTAQNNAFAPRDPHTPEYQAYGIPQSGPGSKMASAGADWKTNPQTQVRWGLGYIKGRYGTPCGAWAHSEAVNWY